MRRFQRLCSADRRSRPRSGLLRITLALAVLVLGLAGWLQADAQTSVGQARPQITRPVNEANLATLAGNMRPEARNPANDRGTSLTTCRCRT